MKNGAGFKLIPHKRFACRDVALPESVKRVDIIPVGRGRLIMPAGEGWDSWFDEEGVTDDFMASREQPADQEREAG